MLGGYLFRRSYEILNFCIVAGSARLEIKKRFIKLSDGSTSNLSPPIKDRVTFR